MGKGRESRVRFLPSKVISAMQFIFLPFTPVNMSLLLHCVPGGIRTHVTVSLDQCSVTNGTNTAQWLWVELGNTRQGKPPDKQGKL